MTFDRLVVCRALVVSCALSIGACSDDDVQIAMPWTFAAAPVALADGACTALEACNGFALAGDLFADPEQCRQRYKGMYGEVLAPHVEAVDSGDLIFSESALERCLESMATCQLVWPAGCSKVLQGELAVGSACDNEFECAVGSSCVYNADCEGRCQTLLQEGETCGAGVRARCLDNLYCDRERRACMKRVQEGGDCSGGRRCSQNLRCVTFADSETETDKRCVDLAVSLAPVRQLGESCGPDVGLCVHGLHCLSEAGGGTCAEPFEANGPCQQAVPDACPRGQYCDDELGKCAARASAGTACSTDVRCLEGLSCDDSICWPFADLRLGEPCEADAQCASLRCESGACQAPHSCSVRQVGQ